MSETLSSQTSFPKFLSNTASGEDLFEGKSQEKVAYTISDTIKNYSELRVIGIDGGWGTGKSNLIAIIKSKLDQEQNKKFHFFIYDAWGHQEDLQRRSFLEELTDYLTTNSEQGIAIINEPQKWKKKLKELLAKSKETQTKTMPSLSLGIVIAGLALITTPIFKAVSENIKNNVLKVIITAVPLVVLLGIFLVYFFWIKRKVSKWSQRAKDVATDLFYLYQKNQTENTTYESISEDEPSTRRFRKWMDEISTDLNGSQLIVVFDNMDRLPGGKVTELWSSIHTFFAESKYDNIKVLIPFDRQNIQEAFQDHLKGQHNYANDYINKTFNVVYRVSPVILSDWKRFFNIKWMEAFGQADDEFDKVVQAFDHLSPSKTPREIVVFINDFVSTIQINTNIPHRYVALFLACKDIIIKNPDLEILSPSYLGSLNFLYQNDENLPKFIAALLYQIDPERSIEVVFTGKLATALNNNNQEDIKTISEAQNFQYILSTAITYVENYENSVLGLESIEEKLDGKIWNDLYWKLDDKTEKLQEPKIRPFNLVLLKKLSGKKEYLKKTVQRLIKAEKLSAVDYYHSLVTIEEFLASRSLGINLADALVKVKVSAEEYLSLIKVAKKNATFLIHCDNEELNKYLTDHHDSAFYVNSDHLADLPDSYNLETYLQSLEAEIMANQDSREKVAEFYICYKNASRGQLLKPLDDNYIYTHFQNSIQPFDDLYYDIISMRIARLGSFSSSYSSYFVTVLESPSDELISKVANTIQYHINYGDILINLKSFDEPLFKSVAKLLTSGEFKAYEADIAAVLKGIDTISAKGDLELDALITKLDEWKAEDVSKDDIAAIIPNLKFFEACLQVDNELTRQCIKLANEYFELLDTDTWMSKLVDSNMNFIKVSLITSHKVYGLKAFVAIKNILNKIAKKDQAIPDQKLWSDIIKKSNANSVKTALKDIRDIFNSSHEIDPKLFAFFGNWLFEYGEMEGSPNSLRRIFKNEIIKDPTCLEIILRYGEQFKGAYRNSHDKEHFILEIKALAEEELPNIDKLLFELEQVSQ